MGRSATDTDWSQVSAFVADAMGLHFPRERWADLQRGLAGATEEFDFDDVTACADWLLSAQLTKEQLQVLASHLTVGETYFFREPKTFEIMANALSALVHSRRGREQRLRLWSAGCCSGEEAYSLAIMLHQIVPDLRNWQVTVLATDINPRFLQKAVAGSYGEWSFRNAPAGFRERYFNRSEAGRYEVMPYLKAMVTFAHLNLAVDCYPSLATDTNAMDLIFCRNVLMYFTPTQIGKVLANLHHSLINGGWLAVGPSETSQALFSRFTTRNFPGTILYQKSVGIVGKTPSPSGEARGQFLSARERPGEPREAVASPKPPPPTRKSERREREHIAYGAATGLFAQGFYSEAAATLLTLEASPAREPRVLSLLARALANQGELVAALRWCDLWLVADKLDSSGHYLRALILLEQGDRAEARISLQRAVFLTPGFVLAHFALGNLARGNGKRDEAARHFSNAQQLLARHLPGNVLPESDGLTAGRLTETITAMTTTDAVP